MLHFQHISHNFRIAAFCFYLNSYDSWFPARWLCCSPQCWNVLQNGNGIQFSLGVLLLSGTCDWLIAWLCDVRSQVDLCSGWRDVHLHCFGWHGKLYICIRVLNFLTQCPSYIGNALSVLRNYGSAILWI